MCLKEAGLMDSDRFRRSLQNQKAQAMKGTGKRRGKSGLIPEGERP
jgi:hypothetical protein